VEDAKKNLVKKSLNSLPAPNKGRWCVYLIPAVGTGVAGGAVRSVLESVSQLSKDHQTSQRCQSNFDALLQMRSDKCCKTKRVSLEKF
jgi:hypothetical protein